MINNLNVIAIIPARGGSKRLPGKNILDLAGKPLIAWTIEAALNSKYIDKIVVSTDDEKISDISSQYGVDIVKRPAALATDTASTFNAVKHALDKYDRRYGFVLLLQPTSPMRTHVHIDEAFDLLDIKTIDAVISVCKTEHSPLWAGHIEKNGDMSNFICEELKNKRSQDLPRFYRINGAIYICNIQRLISEGCFFIKDNVFAYFMEKKDSIDIDERYDFDLAEFNMLKRKACLDVI